MIDTTSHSLLERNPKIDEAVVAAYQRLLNRSGVVQQSTGADYRLAPPVGRFIAHAEPRKQQNR
jgi:hypothetical protein